MTVLLYRNLSAPLHAARMLPRDFTQTKVSFLHNSENMHANVFGVRHVLKQFICKCAFSRILFFLSFRTCVGFCFSWRAFVRQELFASRFFLAHL